MTTEKIKENESLIKKCSIFNKDCYKNCPGYFMSEWTGEKLVYKQVC